MSFIRAFIYLFLLIFLFSSFHKIVDQPNLQLHTRNSQKEAEDTLHTQSAHVGTTLIYQLDVTTLNVPYFQLFKIFLHRFEFYLHTSLNVSELAPAVF